MCMCPLKKPGVTTKRRPSITRSAETSARSAALPTRAIRWPSTRIEASWTMRRSASRVRAKRACSIFRVVAGIVRSSVGLCVLGQLPLALLVRLVRPMVVVLQAPGGPDLRRGRLEDGHVLVWRGAQAMLLADLDVIPHARLERNILERAGLVFEHQEPLALEQGLGLGLLVVHLEAETRAGI